MSDPTRPPYDPGPSPQPPYDPGPSPQPPYDPGPSPQPPYGPGAPQPPSYASGPPSYAPGPQAPSYQSGPGPWQPAGYPPPGYPSTQPYGAGAPGYPPPGPPGMPGQPGYPAVPPSGGSGKKSRVGLIVAVVAAVVLLLCGGSVAVIFFSVKKGVDAVNSLPTLRPTELPSLPGLPNDPSTSGPANGSGATVPVVFEVTGDGPARISYSEQGGLKKLANQKIPWRMEIQARRGFSIALIANREGPGSGKITCRVLVDGEELTSRNNAGPFSFVACTTFVPR